LKRIVNGGAELLQFVESQSVAVTCAFVKPAFAMAAFISAHVTTPVFQVPVRTSEAAVADGETTGDGTGDGTGDAKADVAGTMVGAELGPVAAPLQPATATSRSARTMSTAWVGPGCEVACDIGWDLLT
jgi:hypothetical protein